MEGKMKVAVMTDIQKIEFEERPIPQPKRDEVLVKVEYVGVCGSDLHYFEHGRVSNFVVKPPFVLGHECAGTVVEVGEAVRHLKAGDRVALEPGKTCGKCEQCRTGKYNLCPDVAFFATPPIDGVFQEYVAHEAALCFKLPENVSTLEGALIEPLAVGFHAARQGGAEIGQSAVVFGAGCIGLVCMMALKAMGLSKVYVVDIQPKRLEKALALGATGVIDAKTENTLERLKELSEGRGFDLAIETAGSTITSQQSFYAVKKGGTVVLVGYNVDALVPLPVNHALDNEITVKTIFRYRHIYPLAIDAVASGKVNLKGLVTNLFNFDDIQRALRESIENKVEIVKAAIRM